MTPHEHLTLDAILAAMVIVAFLLGRYLWPSNRGLAAQFDQEYQAGCDDTRARLQEELNYKDREIAWLEVQLADQTMIAHDSLHSRYEVLSPAALDAVNSLPGRSLGFDADCVGESQAGAGEFHDDDWPTDYRLSPGLGLGQPGDGSPATFSRSEAIAWSQMVAFRAERDELDRELMAA